MHLFLTVDISEVISIALSENQTPQNQQLCIMYPLEVGVPSKGGFNLTNLAMVGIISKYLSHK